MTILVLIGIIFNLLLTFVKGLLGFDIQYIYLVGVDLLIVDPLVEGLIDAPHGSCHGKPSLNIVVQHC